jgi:hypothetical protein
LLAPPAAKESVGKAPQHPSRKVPIMDRHDAEDLRRFRDRKRKQKEYQADYRRKLKKQRTPTRDDIAAGMLAFSLEALARKTREQRDVSFRKLAEHLATVGVGKRKFDREATIEACRAMVEREIKRLRRRERGE